MAETFRNLPLGLSLRRAAPDDIPQIQQIVTAAYTKYIERIGRKPAPMTADYLELLQSHDVFVLKTCEEAAQKLVGSIVLATSLDEDSIKINNLVVDPQAQGKGYGRILMTFAEHFAKESGQNALTLFTNTKMYENLTLYDKMGFKIIDRRTEDGYERVYFRRGLS